MKGYLLFHHADIVLRNARESKKALYRIKSLSFDKYVIGIHQYLFKNIDLLKHISDTENISLSRLYKLLYLLIDKSDSSKILYDTDDEHLFTFKHADINYFSRIYNRDRDIIITKKKQLLYSIILLSDIHLRSEGHTDEIKIYKFNSYLFFCF